MTDKIIKVAQIRGNGLSDRETKTWDFFGPSIKQTVFAARKNVYSQSPLPFPVITLRTSADNFLSKNFYKYFFGQYQRFFGLEKLLAGFNIVHAGELYNYYTVQAVRAKRINPSLKVVATVWENSFGRFEYNYWPGFSMPPRYWRSKLKSIMSENAAGVDKFLPATRDAAALLEDFGVDPKKIQVVTPGVIPAGAIASPELSARYAGAELYLMVNRLVKEKGVYDILYGWRMYLRATGSRGRKLLLIAGEGPERQNMERLIKEWGMEGEVKFLGQRPYAEVLSLFSLARCLLLGSIPRPFWQEQFGYVLAEAICAGVPSISANSGAIAEVVGDTGLLVPPAHPIALSRALLELDNGSVYERLKKNCESAKIKFSAAKYAEEVSKIYHDLATL